MASVTQPLTRPVTRPLILPANHPLAKGVGGPNYTGLGDVLAGASAYWSPMAYSRATAGTDAVTIVRASDSASQTFKSLASGLPDAPGIATFLAATTGKVSELKDQASGTYHALQGTGANRPSLSQNVVGTLPAISALRSASQFLETANNLALAAPTTMFAVWRRTGTLTSNNGIMGAVGANYTMGAQGNVARTYMYCGTFLGDQTASADNTFHASAAVANGASSRVYEDSLASSVGNSGSGTPTGHFRLFSNSFGDLLDGDCFEWAVYPFAITQTQAQALIANARSRWGLL